MYRQVFSLKALGRLEHGRVSRLEVGEAKYVMGCGTRSKSGLARGDARLNEFLWGYFFWHACGLGAHVGLRLGSVTGLQVGRAQGLQGYEALRADGEARLDRWWSGRAKGL
eukprot:1160316-Pelagomonas_calceolata.AAC.2